MYDGPAECRTPSLPQSSGNSTNASKRTFSGGKPVVLNSDSDSDSLTDLEELWNAEPISKPKAGTREATAGKGEESKRSGLPRPPKRLKDDKAFKRLVQAAQRNAEMEQDIAKAQAELDKPLREDSPERGLKISEEMVAGALHDEDDPEKAKKLYLAMQRTNAFQVECAFHFFDRESDDDSALDLPFPLESLSYPRMVSKFEDDSTRDQAFLSGFAGLLFSRDLPEELADWLIQEAPKFSLHTLISDILLRVRHPILQRNLVTALPTHYPLTASIQRYLALSFLLHPTKITHPLTSSETLNLIHDHLQNSPNLCIKKDTDYAILAAHFHLLDVAIGPGPLTVPFQPIISPPTSQDSQGLELIEEITPTSDEVKAFNREVDALAQQIKLIGNGIHVAGAITDLSRLAASDACDRLCTRLEHVVRIGGRKVKNVFGEDEEGNEGSKATFKKWLGRTKTQPRGLGEMLAKGDPKDGVAVGDGGGERIAEKESDSAADVTIKNEHNGGTDFAERNTTSGAAMTGLDTSVKFERNV
ncbi:uncharacterized protein N0V89_004089 [Didymosphaeria variabile]|uniref:Uncharacterized protein n=1 Tax=Didymosphaeria variabile TaxID=1932322 RepID=A0A9W8XPR0_9PLEO|nr:uncharacterized protein N0V89_004089 [Didymosphaeria variabile]KAJ4356062.1 hypothetical protein N0V89_004089 [Didymosphaeria variabile]